MCDIFMMDYLCHAISPGLSQASCGSPNYESEFTSNGSPGQCSLRSDMSMSPGRMSPGTLHKTYSVFTRPSTTVNADTTSTPYSDATQPKKPAKEGRIKRPMNAFMVWAQQERRKLTAHRPGLHNAEISKNLGHVWKLMLEEEKKVWREEAARLKELHDREFPFYKYQPRKNKNKTQKKPVITDSGRVSKPTGMNREVTTKPPAKASRSKAGDKSKASGGKKNPAFLQVSTTTIGAEVKGVRQSQKVPSSPEITPPAQSGDLVSVDFPTTHSFDEDTALPCRLDELPHAVTPAAVMKVGDSLIVSQYQSGATVTYNRDTKECRFNNLAPLQAIPDLSSIDCMCMNALDVDPTACEEIDNIRNIISDINWEDIAQDAVTDNDFTMINEDDIEYVSDTLPDIIFAETP